MGRNIRDTTVGLISGSSWFTPVSVAANMGILPDNIDKISLDGNVVEDDSIGQSDIENVEIISHIVEPTMTFPLRRSGAEYQVFAGLFGDDTVTGVGPYTHTFNWQNESAFFYTMAMGINSNADILEWPSLKFKSVTLEPDGEGFMQFSTETIGDTINVAGDATNDATSLGNVTYITKALRIPFRELRFRINAQASGALGSGDEIGLSNISLKISRPMDREELTVGVSTGREYMTSEPVQNKWSDITLSFTVPDYTTIGLLDDMKDRTEYKADLYWAKTVSGTAYSLLIELGKLQPLPQDIAAEGGGNRYGLTRSFRCVKPTSAPTGMATANPIHMVLVDGFATTYE